MRALVIPLALCEDFEHASSSRGSGVASLPRVVAPWEAGVAEAPSATIRRRSGAAAGGRGGGGGGAGRPVFTGLSRLDERGHNAGKKENVRAALVAVHTPEILRRPRRYAASGSRSSHRAAATSSSSTEGEASRGGGARRAASASSPPAARARHSRCAHLRSAVCRWRRWRVVRHSCVISTEGALFSFGPTARAARDWVD